MTTRDSILDWLSPNDDAIRRIHAQLEHLATFRLPTPMTSWIPCLEDLREFIQVAFWASLRSNEERPTRVRLALTPREFVPDAFALASPADYDETQVAKLAHVLPPYGNLLVSPEADGLKIWGLSRTPPGAGIDGITAEIASAGIVRVDIHMFRPFVVFKERSAFIIEGAGRVGLAAYFQKVLLKRLSNDDIAESHQVWHECIVLGVLARMIVDQGHGGTILVVPDGDGDWLNSIDPFAFRFSAPDNTAQEWVRQNLPFNQSRNETIDRITSSNLSEGDIMTVMVSLTGRPWQPREAVQHIAPLANCDGAIIMTHDLRVLGFGAKIGAHKQAGTTLYILDAAPGLQELKPCSLENFGGTRHQSAVRFVSAHRKCVAVVISQDRRMSVVNWSEEHNCVIAVEHAEWWS